jgi:hypothetical protein
MLRRLQSRISFTARAALVLAGASMAFAPAAFAADATPCAANPANRALDFWVGQWKISGEDPGATSKVSLDLDKCMVVERWDGGRGHTGENLFGYSADDHSWHGLFADNEGRVHVFLNGKVSGGVAEFTGPSRGPHGEVILNRITIRRISDTKAQQAWEKSSDGGKSWKPEFHLDYIRTK